MKTKIIALLLGLTVAAQAGTTRNIYTDNVKSNGTPGGTLSINTSGTVTIPAVTDTLVGKATTDTLTNKTLTSPTLTTPALGTPASGVLTNATGLPLTTGITGTLGLANGGTGATGAAGATAALNAMVGDSGAGGTKGLVPAPSAGDAAAVKYLKADGTWEVPAGAGSVTSVAMTVPSFLSISGSPITGSGTLAVSLSGAALPVGFTSTATAAGTTTMTIADTGIQEWTGSTTQTVKLPTTSVAAGLPYTIINNSTGNVTVQSSGANSIIILTAGSQATFTALVATPTTAANWKISNCNKAPTFQEATSGTGTFTLSLGVKSIEILICGAGGGGAGATTGASTVGSNGSNSTFSVAGGAAILTANGGQGGQTTAANASVGGTSGSFTIGSPAYGYGKAGGTGSGGIYNAISTAAAFAGGPGGSNLFGGAGGGGSPTGNAAAANTGGGGGGGGMSGVTGTTGAGGGPGGMIRAWINAPSATYDYSVGAVGTGTAGSGAGMSAGGNGGLGYIGLIERY